MPGPAHSLFPLPLDSSPGLLGSSLGGWRAAALGKNAALMQLGDSFGGQCGPEPAPVPLASSFGVGWDNGMLLGSFAAPAPTAAAGLHSSEMLSLSFASALSARSPRDGSGRSAHAATAAVAASGGAAPGLRGSLPPARTMRLGTRAAFATHPDVVATTADAATFQLLDCRPATLEMGDGAARHAHPL
jgi:hypothetical protein